MTNQRRASARAGFYPAENGRLQYWDGGEWTSLYRQPLTEAPTVSASGGPVGDDGPRPGIASPAPPGWYPQLDGTQRYWDGSQWTRHVAAVAGALSGQQDRHAGAGDPAMLHGATATATLSKKPNWFGQHQLLTVVVAIVALLLVGMVGAAANGSGKSSSTIPVSANAGSASQTARTNKAAADKAAADKAAADKAAAEGGWTVSHVVDGDTVDVTKGGTTQRIRVIGIDTPEIGVCGYLEATANMQAMLAGKPVNVAPGARDNRDQYGRYLRYLDIDGTDAGLRQIQDGFAVARYDSRDGYGGHPREAPYVAADAASPAAPCSIGAAQPTPSKPANPAPVKPTSSWPLAGDQHPCPQTKPIKGNQSSMIAHSPGQQSYLVTNPEACFSNLTDAAAAGYRPAKR